MKEPFAFHRRRSFHRRRHQTARTLPAKVNAGKGLIHLERAWFACRRVDMVPVIQAERHVAVLLNLKHYDVAAQSVNRPRRCENGISGHRSEACEAVPYPSVRERMPPQTDFGGAWLRPE